MLKKIFQKFDLLFLVIAVVNFLILIFYKSDHFFNMVSFVNMCSLFLILFFLLPLVDTKKEQYKKTAFQILCVLRLVMGALFGYSLYTLFYSKAYDVSASIVCLFIIVILLILIAYLGKIIRGFLAMKKGEKTGKLRFFISTAGSLLLLCFFLHDAVNIVLVSHKQIHFSEERIPYEISVYEPNANWNIGDEVTETPVAVIRNSQELKQFVDDLYLGNNRIRPCDSLEKLNFERYKYKLNNYYRLEFSYKGFSSFDEGYIQTLEILPGRKVMIHNMVFSGVRMLKATIYKDYYPVTLSEDSYGILEKYLK